MTREEAIAVFKAFMDNPLFSDVHKAAFNIAIHDIKQRHDWDINKLMLVPKTEWEQEPQTFRWCTDCREYDQEKHCCHRWSKVIRNTAEEMKQGYIEREVLDKIRAEIEQNAYPIVHGVNNHELGMTLYGILQILDKYKAESERK